MSNEFCQNSTLRRIFIFLPLAFVLITSCATQKPILDKSTYEQLQLPDQASTQNNHLSITLGSDSIKISWSKRRSHHNSHAHRADNSNTYATAKNSTFGERPSSQKFEPGFWSKKWMYLHVVS
jgi:hypothetical protein